VLRWARKVCASHAEPGGGAGATAGRSVFDPRDMGSG
jgi:hypothetical protein